LFISNEVIDINYRHAQVRQQQGLPRAGKTTWMISSEKNEDGLRAKANEAKRYSGGATDKKN